MMSSARGAPLGAFDATSCRRPAIGEKSRTRVSSDYGCWSSTCPRGRQSCGMGSERANRSFSSLPGALAGNWRLSSSLCRPRMDCARRWNVGPGRRAGTGGRNPAPGLRGPVHRRLDLPACTWHEDSRRPAGIPSLAAVCRDDGVGTGVLLPYGALRAAGRRRTRHRRRCHLEPSELLRQHAVGTTTSFWRR